MSLDDLIYEWLALTVLFLLPFVSSGQSYNYWTRSFNEESSLVSGAVVGGGSGPSAIYYNPASISEITQSKFTLNASLFSFDFINIKNGLGDGIDINSTRGNIKPRFISYMIQLKKYPNWSYQFAYLNNENTRVELTESVDRQMDILTQLPGDERYFAIYQASNYFRDDWIGMGGSVRLNTKIFLGFAFFVTIKSSTVTNLVDIEAFPLHTPDYDTLPADPGYSARYYSDSYAKYNDYRILGKAGILYKEKSFSAGICITTPSQGLYTDGKRAAHTELQSNIHNPETGVPIPDYIIADYKEKGDVDVSYKTPFSVSAGITYNFLDNKRTAFFSTEFFTGIEPYRLMEANESADISYGFPNVIQPYDDWLTKVSGAKPVLNAAIGYSWTLKQDLRLMAGFRTDFNYQKNFDYEELGPYHEEQYLRVDLYHITGGLAWKIFGQDITTGLEYHVGKRADQLQLINFSDPVEYNTIENAPLQGTRNDNLTAIFNSVSIYLGASFNFGGEKK
jgi:hypothetical protein